MQRQAGLNCLKFQVNSGRAQLCPTSHTLTHKRGVNPFNIGHWTPGILEDIEYLEYKRTLNTKPPTEVTHASSQYKNDRQSISGFGLQLENDERDH